MSDLVSIVIPVYNAKGFLKATIETVVNQTYSNWECIFVDDCSKDESASIIEEYIKMDTRLRLIKKEKNGGAAESRNIGIDAAQGRYICFLDADDKWDSKKLEKQIEFMKEKDCAFSYTSYEFADINCNPTGKKVMVPESITYKGALKNTTIWTTTVMFDMRLLSKQDIYMPLVPSEDTACWWKVLKKIDKAYGIKEVLAYYRRTPGTLSSNKLQAIKRIWNLYRNVEKLNVFYSAYNFCWYALRATLRRI